MTLNNGDYYRFYYNNWGNKTYSDFVVIRILIGSDDKVLIESDNGNIINRYRIIDDFTNAINRGIYSIDNNKNRIRKLSNI